MAYWGAGVSRETPFHDERPGRAARVRELFADATGVAAAVLDQVRDDAAVQFSAVETAWVEDPVAGHVVLIGDAWHAATPNMAQGAAMPPKTSWCSPRSWAATRGVRRSMNRCAGLPPAGCRGSATCRRPPPCATAWRRCRCSSGSGSCPLGAYQQGVLRAAGRQAMSKPTTEEL